MFNEKQKQAVLLFVTTTNKVTPYFAGPCNPYRFVLISGVQERLRKPHAAE